MTTFIPTERRHLAPLMFSRVVLLALSLSVPAWALASELPPIRESQSVGVGGGYSNGDSLSLTDRIARLEDRLEGPMMVEMLVRIEALQRDVQELRGQNEVYAHEVRGMKKRQRDLYLDIDRRLRQLLLTTPASGPGSNLGQGSNPLAISAASVASPSLSGLPAAEAADMTAAPAVAIDPQAEQLAYRQAFNVLKEGRYEDSITAFAAFFKRYPEGQYADNAVYWMGEANYVLRRFPAAIERFNQVLSQYPHSPKLADAMLKIGFSHYELQAWPEARQVLEDLGKRYPISTAAQLAKNRLHRMKVDGR